MPSRPGDRWYSTPAAKRGRVPVTATVPREMAARLDREADGGVPKSHTIEDGVALVWTLRDRYGSAEDAELLALPEPLRAQVLLALGLSLGASTGRVVRIVDGAERERRRQPMAGCTHDGDEFCDCERRTNSP